MTKEDFIKFIENDYPQNIKGDFDHACPCGGGEIEIDGYTFGLYAKCWRVSENVQDLHIWGNHPEKEKLAKMVKKQLDKQEWYNPYTIIYSKFK